MTKGVEPLDEDKIDRREPRDEVFERRMRPIADLVHERPARVGHEHDLLRACLPVDERVLARSIAERLQAHGVRRVDPPAGVESNGLWFHDHDANLVEIAVAPKTSPNEKSQYFQSSAAPLVRGAPNRTAVKRTHPRRLAHVLMFTTDVTKAIDFYSRVLGLRLSDHSGDGIAFMHGMHGSDHHMIALGKSNAPGLHHLSWDVGTVDEIGLGAMRMLGKGYDKGWGLGRHVLGSNFFHYVRDPWGSFAEYSADIDFVPHDADWPAADHPPEDSFYV